MINNSCKYSIRHIYKYAANLNRGSIAASTLKKHHSVSINIKIDYITNKYSGLGNAFQNVKKSQRSQCFSNQSVACWSCGKDAGRDASGMFCAGCQSLQNPKIGDNYFSVLGVNETYDLNEAQLALKYKALQRLLHPDKFSNKKAEEQKISEEFSSLVNLAYSTLLHPLSRGIYILESKGVEIPEKTQLESEFLHKIMELNEEVDEADSEEEVLRLSRDNKDTLAELENQLSMALAQENINQAIGILIHMKYYVSIETNIKSLVRKMGIVE